MSKKNALVEELINSLTNNWQDWEMQRFHAFNKSWGIYLWIANGALFIEISHPTSVKFSYWDRRRIYKAVKKCRELYILNLTDHDTKTRTANRE